MSGIRVPRLVIERAAEAMEGLGDDRGHFDPGPTCTGECRDVRAAAATLRDRLRRPGRLEVPEPDLVEAIEAMGSLTDPEGHVGLAHVRFRAHGACPAQCQAVRVSIEDLQELVSGRRKEARRRLRPAAALRRTAARPGPRPRRADSTAP